MSHSHIIMCSHQGRPQRLHSSIGFTDIWTTSGKVPLPTVPLGYTWLSLVISVYPWLPFS